MNIQIRQIILHHSKENENADASVPKLLHAKALGRFDFFPALKSTKTPGYDRVKVNADSICFCPVLSSFCTFSH